MSPRRQKQLTLEPEAEAPVSRETAPRHDGPLPFQDLIRIPLDLIEPSPLNPRKKFDEGQVANLAASMSTDGQLQPILLRPTGKRALDPREHFTIVMGERRFRAAQLLGWQTIAATVRHMDEREHARIAMIENLERSDLNAVEEARGYQQLLGLGMTQGEIADAVHRSRPAVANALRLVEGAPEPVLAKLQELGDDGKPKLTPSHVLPLLRYRDFPDVVMRLAEIAEERHTPSKDLEQGFDELGYAFHHPLIEAKLIAQVEGYRAEFDVEKICGSCPFGAFQRGRYTSYCLRPEHFRQLQKEARAVKKAEVDELVQAVSADGTTVLQLRSLKYGQYENLSYGNVPKACSPKCECRAIAMDGARQVKVCRNPTRFRKLQDEQRRQDEADRKARIKDLSDRGGQVLQQVDVFGARELAVLAAAACRSLDESARKALLTKYAVKDASKRSGAIDFEAYAQQDSLVLLKLAVEAVLSADITHSWNGSPIANWYAGPAPKPEKAPKAKRTGRAKLEISVEAAAAAILEEEHGFDPDARLAEEIASEQQRLEAEFAAAVLDLKPEEVLA